MKRGKGWKKLNATSVALISAVFVAALPLQPKQAAAADVGGLLGKLDPGLNVCAHYVDDYDGDGRMEMFAVTGELDGVNELWFVGEEWMGKLYSEGMIAYVDLKNPVCPVEGNKKLFVEEWGAHGSGSISKCFYVEGGRPVEVGQGMEGLVQLEEGSDSFAIHPSSFDNMYMDGSFSGHCWRRYWLRWSDEEKRFIEYVGEEIKKKVIRGYKNGPKILNRIKKTGYKIGKIYRRENSIININVEKQEGGTISYENVTLKARPNGKLAVQKGQWAQDGEKDIVKYSTYGGIYEKAGFYPDGRKW